ncbi:MAG: DsbA family protein [Nanoarchaeota archaeon]
MEEKANGTITLKKSTMWKIGTFLFAGLFVISLFTGGFGIGSDNSGATGKVVAPSPTPTVAGSGSIRVTIDKDDPVLGDPDAPVTIVEFSDFQCPFCARAFNDALAEFRNSDYFKDGQVNLVYKDFPLNSIHPQAQKAAEAAQCAHDQGKFWEYHDALFQNQGALDVNSLKGYADDVGLDTGKFNECLDSGKSKKEVDNDLAAATAAGGRGTPYFVVVNNKDGKAQGVSGAVPFSNIEAAINNVA